MNSTVDGYRGIWFTLGQFSEYGDKYSGGLGTYTMKHSPLAVYAPQVDKTFFTYGGVAQADSDELLIMASAYDHAQHTVPRPAVVCRKVGVNDPHDNASIALDDEGYVWIFVSGRGDRRPGFVYRSDEPYSVWTFTLLAEREMAYPQPHHVAGTGFVYLYTRYSAGRELYWQTSPDGVSWSPERQLAGFGGHYQVSVERGGVIVTAFDYHPTGAADPRTNLYVLVSRDRGDSWTTVDGASVDVPLTDPANPALAVECESRGRLTYVKDVQIDDDGYPVVLHVESGDHRPGPDGDPRRWLVTSWDGPGRAGEGQSWAGQRGGHWVSREMTTSDHNYDSGSLYVAGDAWTVFAPTAVGPQPWQAGGEMVIWRSTDRGHAWTAQQVTHDSELNHTHARRPVRATDPFYAFWADGDPTRQSPSHLYFGSSGGDCWQLPYAMSTDAAEPTGVRRRLPG